jgi:hypothetical protein
LFVKANLVHHLVCVARHSPVLRLIPLALVGQVLVNLIVGQERVL